MNVVTYQATFWPSKVGILGNEVARSRAMSDPGRKLCINPGMQPAQLCLVMSEHQVQGSCDILDEETPVKPYLYM